MTSPGNIRQQMRAHRRELSAAVQYRAARRVCHQALRLPGVAQARSVALYLPNDGELDPRPLMRALTLRGVACYLPVLHRHRPGRLQFARWRPGMRFHCNRFRIPEPAYAPRREATALDVILMPLVAFDQSGNRLGMGGGFYDRTLAPRRNRAILIGLAHATQYYPGLPAQPWDVPLDGIITDRGLRRFGRRLHLSHSTSTR